MSLPEELPCRAGVQIFLFSTSLCLRVAEVLLVGSVFKYCNTSKQSLMWNVKYVFKLAVGSGSTKTSKIMAQF